MNSVEVGNSSLEPREARHAVGAMARSGSVWIVAGFGASQIIRLASNIALAAMLFEEAFALMALVSAVMVGLTMFSDIGLQQNVIQSPRGDDVNFLNTAWTMQVIRGVVLTLAAAALAWPFAAFYGANDPMALELRWLIPLVALTAFFDGLRSPRMLTAARNMQIGLLTRIELVVQIFNVVLTLGLVWLFRSVYGLAVAGVVSSALHAALSYRMLPGLKCKFILESSAVRSIFSFGKWIFLSTLISFLAIQVDRLTFAAMYPLAEVGVYSIAVSLALVVSALVGRLQAAVVFPWYSRMLSDGMVLHVAFHRAKIPALAMTSYLVVLLVVGADSFFNLAYDERYSNAAVYLPILALGVWFSSLGGMYGAAFLATGNSKWIALVSAVKVVSFLALLTPLFKIESSLVMATMVVLASEIITAGVGRYLGWRLDIKNMKVELGMLAMLIFSSAAGLYMVRGVPFISNMHPLWQLCAAGAIVTLLFLPIFVKLVYPLMKQRTA